MKIKMMKLFTVMFAFTAIAIFAGCAANPASRNAVKKGIADTATKTIDTAMLSQMLNDPNTIAYANIDENKSLSALEGTYGFTAAAMFSPTGIISTISTNVTKFITLVLINNSMQKAVLYVGLRGASDAQIVAAMFTGTIPTTITKGAAFTANTNDMYGSALLEGTVGANATQMFVKIIVDGANVFSNGMPMSILSTTTAN